MRQPAIWSPLILLHFLLVLGCAARPAQPMLSATIATDTLRATGRGALPDGDMPRTQAVAQALRAARADGYARLSEQLFGLQVVSQTIVSKGTAQQDDIRTSLEAFVRGARPISEPRVRETLKIVEIDMILPLGNHLERILFK